jgi:antitoxin HicB
MMEVSKFMSKLLKIPLVLDPQKEGGWTVTSPIIPELITEIDDLKQLNEVVSDAVNAVLELYEDSGKVIPPGLITDGENSPVWFESLIFAGTWTTESSLKSFEPSVAKKFREGVEVLIENGSIQSQEREPWFQIGGIEILNKVQL